MRNRIKTLASVSIAVGALAVAGCSKEEAQTNSQLAAASGSGSSGSGSSGSGSGGSGGSGSGGGADLISLND